MSEQTTAIVSRPHYAGVGMNAFGSGALPALNNLSDVVSIAQLMAKAGIAVRPHLRENPGACLAVTMQALRWNADPFAIANKTFSVNDQLAYESQVIAAVINTMAPIKGRPEYTFSGEGDQRKVTVKVQTLDGQWLDLTTPTFAKIHPKNSPLWKSDPDQQQCYYAIRALGRRHFPEVILGIYDPDEMERRTVVHEGDGAAPSLITSDFDPKARARKAKKDEPVAEAEPGFEEAEFEDTERPTTQEADTETGGAQTAETEPDTSASATAASRDSQGQTDSSAEASSEATSAGSQAKLGEVYILRTDEIGEDGKVPTYKDGAAFSRVKADSKALPPAYDLHAPEPEAAEVVDEEQEAEFEETEEEETPASGDVVAEAVAAIRTAPHLAAARQIQRNLIKTDAYGEAPPPAKTGVRLAIWTRYVELVEEKVETVQPYEDFQLMRSFLDFGATSEKHVDEVWTKFWRHASFKDASEGDRKAMNGLLAQTKDRLKEKAQ